MSNAAVLSRALGFAAANAVVEAFELIGSAVALLNRHGEVMQLNRAAEALLCADLRVVKKRITSHDRLATAALDRALHPLLRVGSNSALMAPILLPRRERPPILAYPVKLSTVSASLFVECQALLVLIDLGQRRKPPQEVLRSSFALTIAEARLAMRMASGAGIETIAGELGISKETARHQLKAVFQKTRVHRQTELVALLGSFLNSRE
jgi:DNA-binding CsgD family transcriptional regulator